MPRIERLDISEFRGIPNELSLLFNGKSVLLFGENGTGKSSFVDALEKLFTGKISTLDGRAQGLSSDRHGTHIRKANPQIKVTFADADSTAYTLIGPNPLPEQVQSYVESARENLYILRRRQILNFIESQPRERYAMLRAFLPLDEVERIELALKKAGEKVRSIAVEKVNKSLRLISVITQELGLRSDQNPSERDVVEKINERLEAVGQPQINRIDELPSTLASLDRTIATFGDLTRQTQVSNALTLLSQFYDSISTSLFVQVKDALGRVRAREAQEVGVFYEGVLVQGLQWIKEEHRETCPLCENAIRPEEVVTHIKRRLDEMQSLVDLRREAKEALARLKQLVQSCHELLERIRREIASMRTADQGGSLQLLADLDARLTKTAAILKADVRSVNHDSISETSDAMEGEFGFLSRIDVERRRLANTLKSLPSGETAKHLLHARSIVMRVIELWQQLQLALRDSTEWTQRHDLAAKLSDYAEAARKQEVQRIFNELSDDVGHIYMVLHPDERHGGIRLEVREAAQGSANLKTSYYEKADEDPRAYYSEAHLDTLGLSLFLALRRWYRRQHPEMDLLILDDVLNSVDTHHAVRVSELLLKEFQDYQILLTTHDRIWFEHLRDIQARCSVSNSFINKIIHKWTLEEGPDIREPEDERQELDRLISEGSGEQIASMAGRLLEHILQEMRYSLRLSVQAKRGEQYEIGDLWPAFYSTIKREFPSFYQSAQRPLDDLDVRWPLRNWVGAHYNLWARNVQRMTAIEFAQSVGHLFDLVFCNACRRFVSPSGTPLGQLACREGQLIYPAPGKEKIKPRTREDLIRETHGALRDSKLTSDLYLTTKRAEAEREH
jgi:DNA repair exonuclease SbcCD ATPase subunit